MLFQPNPRSLKPRYSEVDINWSHPLALGLVAGWLLDEGTGATAKDITRRGATMTRTAGAKLTAGLRGGSGVQLSVDGDFLSTPHHSKFDLANVTIFQTLRSTRTRAAAAHQMSFIKELTSVIPYGLGMSTVGDGMFYYQGSYNASGHVQDIAGDQKIHSIVGVGDVATGFVRLSYYIDGKIDSSFTTAVTALPTNTAVVKIGDYNGSFTHLGEIYNTYLYNYALTPAQIEWLTFEPYAMLTQRVVQRYFFVPASGGGVTPIDVFAADSIRYAFSEYGDVRSIVDVTDAVRAAFSEYADTRIVVDVTDSARAAFSEYGDTRVNTDQTDTVRTPMSEYGDTRVIINSTDSVNAVLTETGAVAVIIDLSDSVKYGFSEVGDIIIAVAISDVVRLALSEVNDFVNSTWATDQIRYPVSDVTSVFVTLDVTDLLPVPTGENATVVVVVDASESVRSALSEVGLPIVSVDISDIVRARMSETQNTAVTTDVTESIRVAVSELMANFADVIATDNVRFAILDVASIVSTEGAASVLKDVILALAAFLSERRVEFLNQRVVEQL